MDVFLKKYNTSLKNTTPYMEYLYYVLTAWIAIDPPLQEGC